MAILKKHDRFWREKVAVYGDYLPWNVHRANGGSRENYPPHSGLILDLKKAGANAVKHFKEMIAPELSDGIVIVTVPSHDPAKPGKGLQSLAAALAESGSRVDGSACLVRSEKIEKLAHGGDRSKEVHLKSVTVAKPELIKGKEVLLLDDVTKTGNSLEACQELLVKAGAKSVQCATIGKT
ncbi:MAG TPA: phosphoribosyltransferase [Xanthobacteraceae bacterium]|nr:phosphoribosyltransferase [Xanthobacteraceae bacterium]